MMGKVIMSGIVPLLEAPSNYDPVFANNTWEQIIEACQKNKAPDTWLVGDQKIMVVNGENHAIDIIGKNHDIYSDGSGTAPLTFQMHTLHSAFRSMNSSQTNVGGWGSSLSRTTYLPEFFNTLPSEVQSGIREVNKLTSAGSQSSTINTTADKLFLLSIFEIFGLTQNVSFAGEGTQYAYYAAGNRRVKSILSGANDMWYTRSPYSSNSTQFCRINEYGTISIAAATTYSRVNFAFCF